MEQFRRMLVSKLRVVFENASAEIELWNKSSSAQVDLQLRERRRNFRRRRESLERVQNAATDLELRIAELETQDERLQGFLRRGPAEPARDHSLATWQAGSPSLRARPDCSATPTRTPSQAGVPVISDSGSASVRAARVGPESCRRHSG